MKTKDNKSELVRTVCLAWATKKRHIAVDGVILCEAVSKSGGYSPKNGVYNGLALSGLPDYEKPYDDKPHGHASGIIDFKPLDQQKTKIIPTSICKVCLKKYNNLLNN